MKAKIISIPGVDPKDAAALRRISMTLHSWHERECGTGTGCIERDETTGRPYWRNSYTLTRSPISDLEAGAMRRLKAIMSRYPALSYYVQTDPRGAVLAFYAVYSIAPRTVDTGLVI